MPGEHAESAEDAKACVESLKEPGKGGVGETLGCALYEHGGMRSRAGESCFMEKRQRRRGKDAI